MDMKEAYKLVYEDLIDRGMGMFSGHFDAANGDQHFMYGIATVMESIAYKAGKYEEFDALFGKNFDESLRKAGL